MFRVILCIVFIVFLNTQQGEAQGVFTIEAERFPFNYNKERTYRKALSFVETEKALQLDSCNASKGLIYASGGFNYTNNVESYFADNSNELCLLTNGTISFRFEVVLTDSSYTTRFTHFNHISATQSPRYSFGIIPSNVEQFMQQCRLDEAWCSLVFYDLIKTCRIKTRLIWLKINW